MDAVIFDLDGTLIDSAGAICAIANRMLAAEGLEVLSLEESTRFVGHGAEAFVRQAMESREQPVSGPLFDRRLALFRRAYTEDDGTENRPYAGVDDMLDALKPRFRVGLCTNKPMAPTRRVLEVLGWEARFDTVVAGDTLALRKPDPAPLLHAVEELGGSVERAVFVGDSEVDAATASAAGMRFALHIPGYRKAPVEALPHDFAYESQANLTAWLRTLV